ncbi:AbrB/MazE/SpoVT family DNA-binding domain-containing protein [Mesorhizobium sp. 128a]
MKTAVHRLHDGSGALILPREILDGLKLQLGDQLEIIETGSGIVLTPVESTDVERQMRTARATMDEYEAELQKLAV